MQFKLSTLLKSTLVSFFISLLIIVSVKHFYRETAVDGYWSRKNSNMLQSYSAHLLKSNPVNALWYQHYQPPFLDLTRAVLARLSDADGPLLVRDIDHGLFHLWSICFAGLAATLFAWAKTISHSKTFSWGVFFLWHLHPSGYAFATYLDATLASAFLITFFLFEWWKLQFKDSQGSVAKTTILLGLLFYVRITFQFLFFIPHLIAVLLMQGQSRMRKLLIFAIPLLIFMPLVLKQFLLFDTFYTSTTSSDLKLGLIWVQPADKVSDEISQALERYHYPINAPDERYNSEEQVRKNISYGMQFDDFIRSNPSQAFSGFVRSVQQNLQSYLKPSFLHANENYLMDAFPYIEIYTLLLSGAGLIFWLTVAFGIWTIRTIQSGSSPRSAVVFLMPIFYIFFMSIFANLYESVEADRYKFFLEPAIFLFVCFEVSRIPEMLRKHFTNKTSS